MNTMYNFVKMIYLYAFSFVCSFFEPLEKIECPFINKKSPGFFPRFFHEKKTENEPKKEEVVVSPELDINTDTVYGLRPRSPWLCDEESLKDITDKIEELHLPDAPTNPINMNDQGSEKGSENSDIVIVYLEDV